ncbi:MAG: maltose ABC transporter substrate-binding protein [Treponema sp.]|nr:maltose ABC transporter substrate-binding protein [Treponema sp.]
MKKIACMFAVVALCASLFAAPAKRITLKVWESDGPEKEFVMWAIREFRKTHKRTMITYEPVGSTDSRAKIELDGPAGVGADVFVAPHDHIGALVNGGHVVPISNSAYLNQFIPAAKTASTYNGKAYGYPLGIETYALFYNKKLIKNPPKTWEEIIQFAKTYNDKTQNKYALVWAVGDGYYQYMFMSSFGAQLFGPNGNDRKQHSINSAASIKGLTYLQNLRKQILDVPSADMTGDFCNSSFIEGKAAMIITGPWKIADFTKSGVDFGIATLPEFPEQNKPATSFSGVRLAFVSSYSEEPEEAAAFAEFLTSREALLKRFEMTRQIPPRTDITTNDPLSNGILAQTKYAVPMPTIPQMGTYWSAMNAAYAGIWDGDDVRTALNSAAAAMDGAR